MKVFSFNSLRDLRVENTRTHIPFLTEKQNLAWFIFTETQR